MDMDAHRRRMHQLAQTAKPHFVATRFSPSHGPSVSPQAASTERNPSVAPKEEFNKRTKQGSETSQTLGSQTLDSQKLDSQVSSQVSSSPVLTLDSKSNSNLSVPNGIAGKAVTKMSSKGPVTQEFTAKGTTPSGKPRLFVCETCTRAFARQEHLKRHERSHTKEKPFACNICSRKFSRRDLLLRHSTKLHAGAADVIPRLRKRSAKYIKSEELESTITTTNSCSTKGANSMVTNATTAVANSEPRLTPERKQKPTMDNSHIKKPRNSSLTASTKKKLQTLIKNNSEGLQLPVLPADLAALYNTLDNKNTQSYKKQHSKGNLMQEPNDNQILDNLEFAPSFRRVSFSAMSGVNYATGADNYYATETVEFSTPQYYSALDDVKAPDQSTEVSSEQKSCSVDNWLNSVETTNSHPNNPHYSGYSFYNEIDDGTMKMTEDFGKTTIKDYNRPNPFKQGSQLAPKVFKNLSYTNKGRPKIENNTANLNSGVQVDEMNLIALESILNTKFPHPVERERHSSATPFDSSKDNVNSSISIKNESDSVHIKRDEDEDDYDIPISDLPPLSPLASVNPANNSGPNYWRTLGMNGLLSGLYNNLKDSIASMKTSSPEPLVDSGEKNDNADFKLNESPENDKIEEDLEYKVRTWQETLFNQPISDLEKINEMHVSNGYGVPQGYSFYGEYESASNSINNLMDSDATISPILLESPQPIESDFPMTDDIKHTETSHHSHTHGRHSKSLSFEEEFTPSLFNTLSHVYLFTSQARHKIDDALAEYPYVGVPTPIIPTNEILNGYVDQFINKFLIHHPFVHKSSLNEYSLITSALDDIFKNSVSKEDAKRIESGETIPGITDGVKVIRDETFDVNFKVSLVCLPFLVTTLGAIVSNKKADAASLYEASRRCIHVYLETRRKLNTIKVGKTSNTQNSSASFGASPLWLVQSLTLSVIYGLFADEEISLSVIIRQVHALNTLLKSSGLNTIQYDPSYDSDFNGFIKYESIVRTIHMVFHVSTLLSTLYNIVPSITVADMGIDLPCSSSLWDCCTPEDYAKIVESFDFKAKNFKNVLEHLILLDFSRFEFNDDFDLKYTSEVNHTNNPFNFFFEWHVSEFGLTCIQNGLHQMAYFHHLGKEELDIGVGLRHSNGQSIVTWANLRNLGKCWNSMVYSCKLYNESSEVFNDSKILNHHLNLKLCSIVSLNKIKESVWLKSFTTINEEYYNYFNYSDDQLKDNHFQTELLRLITNSIDIMKLIFFNDDVSLLGSISQRVELKNDTIDNLDFLYATPPADDLPQETKPKRDLDVINLNILHKLSIDSQILFDVILIIVKFLLSFENIHKTRIKFNNLSAFTFLDENDKGENEKTQTFDELLFKYYVKFFKIYLSLEQFVKMNYDYEDFETEQPIVGNPFYPIQTLRARGLAPSSTRFNESELDRVLRESKDRFKETGQWLKEVVNTDVTLSDKELIMNELIGFKLPYKFLKIGGFLFGFIYDRNFKFVNFRHLSDVLFHLRVFLESKDEDAQ